MARRVATKPLIALTLGDPAGIGPEIALKALAQSSLRKLANFRVVGSAAVLRFYAQRFGLPMPACEIDEPLPWPAREKLRPGRWSKATGRASLVWVERAIELCQRGEADAMVTAPICKAAWQAAGCAFPGHTELLACRTQSPRAVMMFAAGRLRLALVTIHRPLAEVPRLITPSAIAAVATVVDAALRRYFGLRRPRLAILGLNPHAGEEGCLGSEERDIIKPAIVRLRRQGINAFGPLAADTVFYHALAGAWDAVVAMYHDQGLAPLKT
ncbi:MAG: 4-hydroxythreonine-4-phosphate dehydrogenase PdxA, partial [Planctomycetota bacterium]|nr:4-hydroxythreonine-4-phosphate dehydrogenase PdxA [Planctomycetota bacterium]